MNTHQKNIPLLLLQPTATKYYNKKTEPSESYITKTRKNNKKEEIPPKKTKKSQITH